MALPWDGRDAENTSASAEREWLAADPLCAHRNDGRWQVRRWGWRRPTCAERATTPNVS
jgi:hypothetical protein